jgi:hypothetical protein
MKTDKARELMQEPLPVDTTSIAQHILEGRSVRGQCRNFLRLLREADQQYTEQIGHIRRQRLTLREFRDLSKSRQVSAEQREAAKDKMGDVRDQIRMAEVEAQEMLAYLKAVESFSKFFQPSDLEEEEDEWIDDLAFSAYVEQRAAALNLRPWIVSTALLHTGTLGVSTKVPDGIQAIEAILGPSIAFNIINSEVSK